MQEISKCLKSHLVVRQDWYGSDGEDPLEEFSKNVEEKEKEMRGTGMAHM